jgi:hypothetical protein
VIFPALVVVTMPSTDVSSMLRDSADSSSLCSAVFECWRFWKNSKESINTTKIQARILNYNMFAPSTR